jgi:hypothetical protein
VTVGRLILVSIAEGAKAEGAKAEGAKAEGAKTVSCAEDGFEAYNAFLISKLGPLRILRVHKRSKS